MEKQEFDTKLILEVEANPIIYNRKLAEFKNIIQKQKAWEDIANILVTTSKYRL